LNFLIGPFGMPRGKSPSDFLFLLLLAFYVIWAIRIRSRKESIYFKSLFVTPETLLVVSLVLFLLSYLFASTANMSYAQRFALTAGNLQLAPNSTIQRLNSMSRYLPLLAVDGYLLSRPGRCCSSRLPLHRAHVHGVL
jgi:apolipoprotein N-acyltransferase